jgi:hypothetical protein
MPNTAPKTTPDDATIVARLEALGGRWDAEAEQWIIPTANELGLRRLLADISANVVWRTAEAA